jgi:mevalonate kinase
MNVISEGTAFGKLILLGEHAVVYQIPALVCGIGRTLRARASVEESGSSRLTLLAETRLLECHDDPLARAFAALLAAGSGPIGAPVSVKVEGELPPGMGLGFSAAASVAVARAVEGLLPRADGDSVRERATAWERVFHGNPSGVDVAAAMQGGFVRFRRGEGVQRVFPARALLLCVGSTGSPASTKVMVEGVAALRERNPEVFAKTLDGIAALVENAHLAIEKGDVHALGELLNLNQMLLAGWMLSTSQLEELCAAAREAGALGAKLTGSGGGGAMVALAGAADDGEAMARAARIVEAWRALGYEGFEVRVGPPPPT